jgi:L-threonine-O-3-phosphate decarboxylase
MPFSSNIIYHHGGNLRELSDRNNIDSQSILDFSASINPLGPIPELKVILDNALPDIIHYPDYGYKELTAAISTFGGWDESMIVPGNGASELLYAVPHLQPFKRALIAVPSYNDYAESARHAGIPVEYYHNDESNNFQIDINVFSSIIRPLDIIIIGRPNNPTCTVLTTGEVQRLCCAHKDSFFVIDESFIEFTSHETIANHTIPENVMMIRSMTKFYAIPGLRLGYAVGAPHHISQLKQYCIPWSINCIAAKAGIASLENTSYQHRSRETMQCLMFDFFKKLSVLPGIRVYPANCNFFLIKLSSPLTGSNLHSQLIRKGIAIRQCANFRGLDDTYMRIAVRSEQENAVLISELNNILKDYHS